MLTPMWGSAVLDTVLGLGFVYFTVALLASVAVEWWATIQRKRAKFQLRGVQAMLVDDLGSRRRWWSPTEVWAALRGEYRRYRTVLPHGRRGRPRRPGAGDGPPTPAGHRQTDPDGRYTRLPAYLPAADVPAAPVDALLDEPTTEQIGQRIDALGPRALGRSLRTLWERSGGDRAAFLAGIAGWNDAQMQRVSGWYKRWSKRWLVVIGALVALGFGIDSLRIAQTLYTEPTVRAAVIAAAAAADPGTCPAREGAGGEVVACVRQVIAELDQAGLPIGWPAGCPLDSLPASATGIPTWPTG